MTHMSTTDAPVTPEITLGWRLRIAMERAGLKREYMAKRLGVTNGTITRWTHDDVVPRRIYLEHWADLCGVSLSWLRGPDTEQDPGGVNHHFAALPVAA